MDNDRSISLTHETIVNGKKLFISDPWLKFDLWYDHKKEELERIAWNCKGTFGGYVPPFPGDIIKQHLHKEMLEWHEKQIYKIMGIPEEYLNR